MANVSLKNINKVYANGVQAVYDFNLEIRDKEFIVLVGPSGCGKSTTLRMIAGLEEITSGDLYIDGERMNEVPAKDRGIAMVFQSYALYPQMTVYDNMAFGLKLRKLSKMEIRQRIENVAKILGLESLLNRKPKALSGGQRQRVALGRAIVRDAKVFLFDEPLSNLDAKLRVQMRTEIARIHKNIGATSVYVTHDQIEAMTMASRIVVMKDGYIQQIGTPEEIYDHPANVFVGSFIGTPSMGFLKGTVLDDGTFETEHHEYRFKIAEDHFEILKEKDALNRPLLMGIRPENIHYCPSSEDYTLESPISFCEMLGHQTNVYFKVEETQLACVLDTRIAFAENQQVQWLFDLKRLHYFDLETEKNLIES